MKTLDLLPTDNVVVKIRYEKYLKTGVPSISSKRYKGTLQKVLIRIAKDHNHEVGESEVPEEVFDSIEYQNGDGCDYIFKLEIIEPKHLVLIDEEIKESEVEC